MLAGALTGLAAGILHPGDAVAGCTNDGGSLGTTTCTGSFPSGINLAPDAASLVIVKDLTADISNGVQGVVWGAGGQSTALRTMDIDTGGFAIDAPKAVLFTSQGEAGANGSNETFENGKQGQDGNTSRNLTLSVSGTVTTTGGSGTEAAINVLSNGGNGGNGGNSTCCAGGSGGNGANLAGRTVSLTLGGLVDSTNVPGY